MLPVHPVEGSLVLMHPLVDRVAVRVIRHEYG